VLILIVGAVVFLQKGQPAQLPASGGQDIPTSATSTVALQKKDQYPRAKELSTPDAFINTGTTTIAGLIAQGHVVLVDFWTYSCINCQRTIPYLNAWYTKYKDQGLVIVGVHTPEFDFEKEFANVAEAVKKFGIEYPVVLDNDYSTWQAYGNRYWPHEYLIDIDGFVVHDHIGEGGYEETEAAIQKALAERATRLGATTTLDTSLAASAIHSGPSTSVLTPETYFGSARNEFIGNISRGVPGTQTATLPDALSPDTTYLSGTWDIQDQFAKSAGAGKIVVQYQGQIINLVASSETPMTLSLSQDGTSAGTVVVHDAQLYQLKDNGTPGTHTIEITVPSAGLRAFTLTFG
jgi:thiol-disulfide isomerase/thioredoxin